VSSKKKKTKKKRGWMQFKWLCCPFPTLALKAMLPLLHRPAPLAGRKRAELAVGKGNLE
jgi:hypothetical protein